MTPTLVWFRNDLRLDDNPALRAAVERGGPVVPVYIWAPEEEGDWAPGGASRWWLHQSLASLQRTLQNGGARLLFHRGPAQDALHRLCAQTGARAVFWNRRYEPAVIERDRRVEESLNRAGMEAKSFNAALLHEPWTISNKSGRPFQVFSPFWKHCLTLADPPPPKPTPKRLPAPPQWPDTRVLEELPLNPKGSWADPIAKAWQPGTHGAHAQLTRFLRRTFENYSNDRNRPDLAGTSRLSPHLHFGEISPRRIWNAVRRTAARRGLSPRQWRGSQFLAELGWREFAHHLLFHFPTTPTEPLRPPFAGFPWRRNPSSLSAWQRGLTGYPFVDAGMRELWSTGWMHNRVRMVVASFLVKDLLISWREGAAWFWDTLVDADLAQNTLGWQWTAGCGADAAPYFRIFNPTSQGERFDPSGEYVRRWCPELAKLPVRWIHRPHEAPSDTLAAAGITLGKTYPEPIVSHAVARNVALDAYARIKGRP